jgi:Ca2+-transporting ATPase
MAFTTLMLFQMFNVLKCSVRRAKCVRPPVHESLAVDGIGVSLLLQVVVIYTAFLQRAFGTVSLSVQDWVFCAAIASSVLWLREISKSLARVVRTALTKTAV